MLPAMQAGLAGMQRAERGVLTAAHNIANVNTDGFRARTVDGGLRRPDSGAPPPEELADAGRPSDVDLAEEFVHLKQHGTAYRAAAAVIGSADRVLGRLLDIVG